ncbi:G-type lectin S-receptor-like serine/threonine-protein kinase At1g11300 [Euphorbia peplus]|nr:G-type lectin S-receptor-like serine/threonine-protein kinase At1g11300 [Euphorbia peplus]
MEICICRIVAVLVSVACVFVDLGAAIDAVTSSQFIKDSESLTSPGGIFKLGFFSPENSTNRYAGIWYNQISPVTPIWVANRNKPLNDSSGVLKVSEDGNLVVLNGQDQILWSSNVSTRAVLNSTAELTDDGNLILLDSITGNSIWESFQQPSNVLVKNMRLTADKETGKETRITSWKSPSDPSIGSFSAGIDLLGIPQVQIWNGSNSYWRSGPWNGQVFLGIPNMNPVYLAGTTIIRDSETGVYSYGFSSTNVSLLWRSVLHPNGEVVRSFWDNRTSSWQVIWDGPEHECDVYGACGSNGFCNRLNSPICSCLRGFEPKNADEWAKGNWTAGCARRRSFQCEIVSNGSELGKKDGFFKLEKVKVPDFAQLSTLSEQECERDCLNNCSCVAYSYYTDFGCMQWTRDLIDLQQLSTSGADLSVRLSYSEFDNKTNKTLAIGLSVSGAIFLFTAVLFICRWTAKHRERKKKDRRIVVLGSGKHEGFGDDMNQVKLQQLLLFDLQKLIVATDNFTISNKLGEGGFGPVYRGILPDEQEIAVKRLSRESGQGSEEFMNEVLLISKLQHRNLVRLFGCCVEGQEKMLVYEYMSNKSLDAFLFDPQRKQLLDWSKRFCIAQGICRGLLYLHRDSRLRIIHRDLKASNILLDEELNPKISDFGMARIFGGNEDQANTKRVVGTYGYMSPEYAMQGRFSEKSDVFSLGVLLLEIVSGRRNTGFYDDEASSLLALAWKWWIEGKAEALKDSILSDPSDEAEIIRCINVGLLCVQEFAKDRPNVSTVISMLNSEILDLPFPKQPAFAERHSDSSQSTNRCSSNMVPITIVDAR